MESSEKSYIKDNWKYKTNLKNGNLGIVIAAFYSSVYIILFALELKSLNFAD